MPYLISFGGSSISLNQKNDNLTLYPVQTILSAAILKTILSFMTQVISRLPIIIKMFPMISSISVPSPMLLSQKAQYFYSSAGLSETICVLSIQLPHPLMLLRTLLQNVKYL